MNKAKNKYHPLIIDPKKSLKVKSILDQGTLSMIIFTKQNTFQFYSRDLI